MSALLLPTAPTPDALILAAIQTLPSPLSRRAYASRLRVFMSYNAGQPLNRLSVETYTAYMRDHFSVSACNQSLAAIKRLAQAAADHGAIDQNTAIGIQAIKGRGAKGVRSGNWLDKDQSSRIISYQHSIVNMENMTNSNKREQRDRVVIALLLGCGLRRAEACRLRWPQIQIRDKRWVISDLIGKGGRVRTVPIPTWAKEAIDEWRHYFLLIDEGYILRPIQESGRVSDKKLSESAVWEIVRERAQSLGMGDVAPHDLRRTFAKLSRKGGAQIEQIQLALGHASIMTTERYLGSAMDMGEAACDKMGL